MFKQCHARLQARRTRVGTHACLKADTPRVSMRASMLQNARSNLGARDAKTRVNLKADTPSATTGVAVLEHAELQPWRTRDRQSRHIVRNHARSNAQAF
jgi:hypothetical protein